MNKEEKLITFKKNQFYTVVSILAFALGVLVGYFIWGANPPVATTPAETATEAPATPTESAPVAEPTEAQAAEAAEQNVRRYEIPTEGFYSIGPEDAEIILIEFSDFGCIFCATWHNETYEDLMADYPGKIRFVYRNLAFRALPAAEASLCAGEQGSYWEYHDKLFSGEYGLTDEAYIQYAEELNLDMDIFNTCVSEHRYQESIQKDVDFATQLGIGSTPTFFINGLAMVGAQPIEAFKQLIDQELAGAIPE